MRNKNGFTLVELLAVIVILGLIAGVGVLAYTSIIDSSKIKVYESYEHTMHAETMELLGKHVELLPKKNKTKRFSLTDIKIEPINNPRNKSDKCTSSYVDVTRKVVNGVDTFTYKVCLICNDYNKNGSQCKTFEN